MLYCITGKQRSGKSYFCVTIVQDYLRSCNRPIYTNLPLHPDYLCKMLFKSPAKYSLALSRIHLFRKFRSFGEAREFYKCNPDWCKKRLMISDERIKDFWRVTDSNSVIILDELYQYFSNTDYKSQDVAERRRELLAYTRQHGHYKDDMFLISHSSDDLDINIRRGIQYLYILSNSKYSNIFEKFSWLKGLKWPVQFFRVRGYEYGDKDYSDQWALWPSKRIFRCYDSFSKAESVPGKSLPGEDAASSDTGTNTIKNIFHFLKCFWLPCVLVISLIVGIRSAWKGYIDFLEKPKVTTFEKKVLPSAEPIDIVPIAEYLTPLSITPTKVFYPENIIIRKGDFYNGKEIVKIDRQNVYLSDGSIHSISMLCRSIKPTQSAAPIVKN